MTFGRQASDCYALFEDNLSDPPRARLLTQLAHQIDCHEPSGLPQAFAQIEAAQRGGQWIALAASYELGFALEKKLRSRLETKQPLLRAWIFEKAQLLEGEELAGWWHKQLFSLTAQQREAGLLQLKADLDCTSYQAGVARILDYIRAGDCYQVNFTFALRGQAYGHPLALFARLREEQAVRYGALIIDHDHCILSRSPELFVERRGSRLICKPMKGTAARSADAVADLAAARALQASEKNRAENLMIVDLIRNDLGRLAPAGGVHVERLFELETYSSVHQLTSTVVAEPVTATLQDTLEALFPCGSVTGAPKIRAMEIIDEMEPVPRGLYCGALGWIAPNGDHVFNVPIRTMIVDVHNDVSMHVGSGIVADSVPQEEWRECADKAHFAQRLVDELQLIETMRCEAGTLPLLDRHLQRLNTSAAALGFACDGQTIRSQLLAIAADLPASPHRIRLQLARDGQVDIQHAPLEPASENVRLIVATARLESDDRRLHYKTTARKFYDDALRDAVAQGYFDVLFLNEKAQICEGARSNIFIEKNGALLTPPMVCGVLPGVLRQALLEDGRAREHVLYSEDLTNADAIWVGNALRGLQRVTAIDS